MFRREPKYPKLYRIFILFTDRIKRFMRGWDRTLRLFVSWSEHCIFEVDLSGNFWERFNSGSTFQEDYYQRLRDKYT